MKDGFWINYETEKVFLIDEHEMWLRAGNNASKLGVSKLLQKEFDTFTPKEDREKFLLFIMSRAPIMRVRGHGAYWTFEFSSKLVQKPLDAIYLFCKDRAGDMTQLIINNFAKKDSTNEIWKLFKDKYEAGSEILFEQKMTIMKKFSKFIGEN